MRLTAFGDVLKGMPLAPAFATGGDDQAGDRFGFLKTGFVVRQRLDPA
jgi:hypothetical protein